MPRQPKPYLRKQTKSWYCSIGGRQISLGKDREAAFRKFYDLMGDRERVRSEVTTLYELSQAYLDWCQANRSQATYDLHRHYLKSFFESTGRRMRPSQLRVHHVQKWHEDLGCKRACTLGLDKRRAGIRESARATDKSIKESRYQAILTKQKIKYLPDYLHILAQYGGVDL